MKSKEFNVKRMYIFTTRKYHLVIKFSVLK